MLKTKLNFIFTFLTLFCAPVCMEAQNLIPRDVLFGNPEKASPKISPDGRFLAYLAPDEGNVLNVWVRPLSSPQQRDIKATSDKKRGVRSYMWQFDSEHILYLQDENGNENHHLFQTSIATFETKDLTPFSGVKVEIVAWDVKFPDEMLLTMNARDPAHPDLYRLNLKSGKLDLDTENHEGFFDWGVDHQLQLRLAIALDEEGGRVVFFRKDRESPWVKWLRVDPSDEVSLANFTADGQSVYLLTNQGSNTNRLVEANLETKVFKTIWENLKYDITDISINPLTNALESVRIQTDTYERVCFDEKLKEDFQLLGQKLNALVFCVSRDLQDRLWVVQDLSSHKTANFYLFDRASGNIQFLFNTHPALEKYKLSPVKPVTFAARDGMELHGYLTMPSHAAAEPKKEPLPAVLLVHGGPALRDSWGFDPRAQWLANRGYAVLQINYRGSKGYGKDYQNAGNREWGGKMQTDLLDGKNWLVSEGIADSNRVAIMGGSYGGYATLSGLTVHPEEYCCGVDIVGISSLITLLKSIPPYWKPFLAQFERRTGSLREEEFLKSRSPLYAVDKIVKPLLIGQGAHDPRVKQAESDQMVAAMRARNIPVEYILFEDEGHGFARPENRGIFYAAAEDFLSKYLGGEKEPPQPKEDWTPFLK